MDRKPKILVTVQQFADRETPELRPLEEAGFEILLNRRGRPLTEQELIDLLPGVFATLAGGEPYTARVFEHATDLRAVARRCQGFETRTLAYDPVPDTIFARDHGVHLVPLDTLLREADIVTLHLPLAAETVRFINRDRLALMRPTAFLINTGRGAIVDEEALAEALTAGRLAGAGLDAFTVEPPFGSPLLTLDRVIVSPHAAGSDERATAAMLMRCADSILAVARGEDPGPGLGFNP